MMNKRVQVILAEANTLTAQEKAALAGELLASLSPMSTAVTSEWAQIIATRVEELNRADASPEDASDVMREARSRLKP